MMQDRRHTPPQKYAGRFGLCLFIAAFGALTSMGLPDGSNGFGWALAAVGFGIGFVLFMRAGV